MLCDKFVQKLQNAENVDIQYFMYIVLKKY